jgi:hypothetical protein
MLIAGIDPGISGAICLMDDGDVVQVWDMPTLAMARGKKTKHEVDADALALLLVDARIDHAFVELVSGMPRRTEAGPVSMGASSAFGFGVSFGVIKMGLAAYKIPRTFVSAVRWKKALQVPAAKDGARARASQLMPASAHLWTRVKDDGRAEAALIARYGMNQMGRGLVPLAMVEIMPAAPAEPAPALTVYRGNKRPAQLSKPGARRMKAARDLFSP